ncbi:MAG: hypothetical protein WCO71_01950, partial [Pseudomonadota bacterium]
MTITLPLLGKLPPLSPLPHRPIPITIAIAIAITALVPKLLLIFLNRVMGRRGKEENLEKAAKLKNINSWHFSLRPSSQPHDLVS